MHCSPSEAFICGLYENWLLVCLFSFVLCLHVSPKSRNTSCERASAALGEARFCSSKHTSLPHLMSLCITVSSCRACSVLSSFKTAPPKTKEERSCHRRITSVVCGVRVLLPRAGRSISRKEVGRPGQNVGIERAETSNPTTSNFVNSEGATQQAEKVVPYSVNCSVGRPLSRKEPPRQQEWHDCTCCFQ